MRSTGANSYVITTSIMGATHTQVWDASQPLALGHPLQWMIERTKTGLRLRDLSTRQSVIEKPRELSNESIEKGAQIEIPTGGKHSLSVAIRPTRRINPAYGSISGSTLHVFQGSAEWVKESRSLSSDSYIAEFNGKKVFQLMKSGDTFSVTALIEGLSINTGTQSRALSANSAFQLSPKELVAATIGLQGQTWRFALSSLPIIAEIQKGPDAEAIALRKMSRAAVIGFAAFLVMSWLWPKPEVEQKELVPPQFAKIVLSKPKGASTGSPSAPAQSQSAKADSAKDANIPKKVQDAAVVQAFRAKALSNAVSGLLKGGMTKLLAQSDFVSGASASAEARRIFDTTSNSVKAGGPDTGVMNAKNVAVASLGGGAGNGSGVGYGKGEHASVKGQGGSFVKMDTGGSSVDEGLTKDEVGEVIHRHLSEVRYCYESAMLRTPDIEGKLMMNFTIAGSGSVRTADIKSSTLPDSRLDDCILRRLMTWKFPNPRGGVDVAVTYPFIFKTLGR